MKLPFILAKRFVAGESFTSSLPKVIELNNKSLALTLDLLGENVVDKKDADEKNAIYLDLLKGIHNHGLISTISIKLTMLGLDIDAEYCKENLFRLLDYAKKHDLFVNIDMEGSAYTQKTLDIFVDAYKQYGQSVGVVLQAMLHRTKEDVVELANMGANVRLVKGAYKEPAEIALKKMSDIRAAFKEYAKVLLDKTSCPRFGTHDDELVNWLRSYSAEKNIDKQSFEFQMLFGLREETMINLTQLGYKTRIYVPFGTEWFPYFYRRLAERKENYWFVLSTMFKK